MRYTAPLALAFAASTALASPSNSLHVGDSNDNDHSQINIFKTANKRWDGAICKGKVTPATFPGLVTPSEDGGCVRYYQGIDMTGVVTTVNIYFPTVKSACDCIGLCIKNITTCTNWVFKHTFAPGLDHGKRTCTLYSSPNLPTDVTLAYNLSGSVNFAELGANPQVGGLAPLTFTDPALTQQDRFGVSGFIAQDQNSNIYC
ncbi:hypothetical protein V500_11588 [Pseudogymnoascus sp. VKM F-4518 (FW-2643)]|nr:hypothetical protein V500_11588 [Pseudogymnoascus sp. VKM F-4518 (FW-2643)]